MPEWNDSVDGYYEDDRFYDEDYYDEDYYDYDEYEDEGDLEDKMDRLLDKAIPLKS